MIRYYVKRKNVPGTMQRSNFAFAKLRASTSTATNGGGAQPVRGHATPPNRRGNLPPARVAPGTNPPWA
ncbi:MAG: hypothetical protein LBK13_06305, partial [Spirochaetales bacterium]|nr:hypothetical protein [Spirochaetales bacterium]